ncbi:MAG TPA: CDP-alcohol phosphatidyltransferase [Bacteroidales bacterium]|nr:CDP-alcohol phosphatidyltransferase [Bacteroidales bacterium]HRZ49253.1 CDP-alcohol phosphatidyltransferase [Bacteroidales bacterium]
MKPRLSKETLETISSISKGRHRTNMLKVPEQALLAWLVKRIPLRITPDMLTIIGFCGSILVAGSFILGSLYNRELLLLGVLGFAVNWFGDSLDGRVAYYRNTPRKWYGFSLDITVDWITVIIIGSGFIIYTWGFGKWLGFSFVVMYGWSMITALLRYKVTDKYSIDSGRLGPTEVKVLLSLILIAEVIFTGSILYLAALGCIALLVVNVLETRKLLMMADDRDRAEKQRQNEKDP